MTDIRSLLVGAVCTAVFLQPTAGIVFTTDTFVINFQKEEMLISLHSFSLVRLLVSGRVQYTVTDHCLNTRGSYRKSGQKKLSSVTFPKLKNAIIGHAVVDAVMMEDRDIVIEFDNAAKLHFVVDTSAVGEDEEVHRIITKKEPQKKNCPSEHTVITK